MVAHSDGRGGREGPTGAGGTPLGVLERCTNGGEPKMDEGKGPPRGGPDETGTSEGPSSGGRTKGAARERDPPRGGITPDPDVAGVAANGWAAATERTSASPWGEGDPTRVGAARVGGKLGGTSVKGTRILGEVRSGGLTAVTADTGGQTGSSGAKKDVAWTAPGGVAGATETVHDGRGSGD